jgi:hypothetical protein
MGLAPFWGRRFSHQLELSWHRQVNGEARALTGVGCFLPADHVHLKFH